MPKQKKAPWKPTEETLAMEAEPVSLVPRGMAPTDTPAVGDPSLERVIQSMVKLGGSRYATARARRFAARHLTPKAKAKKKLQRHQRRDARRANPSNRGR